MSSAGGEAQASELDGTVIELLLAEKNSARPRIPALQDLSPAERAQTNLVDIDKLNLTIPGDPYGKKYRWAGNVSHLEGRRMSPLMNKIFERLNTITPAENETVQQLQTFLHGVRNQGKKELVAKLEEQTKISPVVIQDDAERLIIRCYIDQKNRWTARLIEIRGVDVQDRDSFETQQSKQFDQQAETCLGEEKVPSSTIKFIIAQWLSAPAGEVKQPSEQSLYELRTKAQENYWMHMNHAERTSVRFLSKLGTPSLREAFGVIEKVWKPAWEKECFHPDYFRQYKLDEIISKQLLPLYGEHIIVATSKNGEVLFASIENLQQRLWGQTSLELQTRFIDMWAHLTPLPDPETKRHQVDNYVRKLHPSLDMAKVDVVGLQKARMCIAHYGTWCTPTDHEGVQLYLTEDSVFSRSRGQGIAQSQFSNLCKRVFAKASKTMQFLLQELDPEYLSDCREIYKALPLENRIHCREDGGEHLTLYALGINPHTMRHADTNGIRKGYAGLLTFGDYEGGNLCLPQLGFKVPYRPGACAILRGDRIQHFVSDYRGGRYLVVGTNHEKVKRHAYRLLGRSVLRDPGGAEELEADWCVNEQGNDEDEEIAYTNEELHGAGVLQDRGP
ncbi:hypothetical protein DL766_004100 [Monosporascus sp. MC13-8B]|uniref:Prolyl 4-hydroxylase alpha subunit domain-containing protein n=1 Tax=Monosporascus cannonballus TaxID=155416 RepID=A0ABY0HI92_9PEZI|nr:hypothetical protein DL762_000793 [Monosporascus cannonballus]RYO96388.1 hypothetical protein DL763_003244 [Monosporascus cannonballus]RYP32093.1 hypothetical protein DL766_004100 [Monosporascus sp. MC13-8B]